MSRFERSLPPGYFDEIYARESDPWRFASSDYERDKYAATLAALPRANYHSALEIGCSIGVLTRQLAARVDTLCSIDLAAKALDEAKLRCADLGHVRFELMGVPAQFPSGRFDLMVLSEIVYYLNRADVDRLAMRLRDCAEPSGDLILVHWTGITHYPLTGDEAAERLIQEMADASTVLHQTRMEAYRLDVLRISP